MDGLITYAGGLPVAETAAKVAQLLGAKGCHVFAVIDHAGNAAAHGRALRPTTLVIFGNPAIGTDLMADQQTAAIDLPSKILIWEDEAGHTHLAHNAMDWLARRHGLGEASRKAVQSLQAVLSDVCGQCGRTEVG